MSDELPAKCKMRSGHRYASDEDCEACPLGEGEACAAYRAQADARLAALRAMAPKPPNPMALEAKALEAAVKAVAYEISSYRGERPSHVRPLAGGIENWESYKDLARSILSLPALAALPLPAAGEGLESTYVPQVIEYEQGGFTELVIEDTATITGDEVVVRVIRRMAAPREIIGFQWDTPGPPLYASTPAARAAVLEAAIDALIAELKRFDRFVFGGTAQSQGGVGIMKEKMIARLTAIRALKEKT